MNLVKTGRWGIFSGTKNDYVVTTQQAAAICRMSGLGRVELLCFLRQDVYPALRPGS